MKKLLAMLLTLSMVFALSACGSSQESETPPEEETPATEEGGSNLVGVAMPTKDLQRWNQDGENMKAQLEAAGYTVDLQYAANDIPTQVSQIENMIANGCEVLVIASIDGEALGTVLDQAKEKNIPVIAYDRLIMGSDAVSYYATFDNWDVGVKQGEYPVLTGQDCDIANVKNIVAGLQSMSVFKDTRDLAAKTVEMVDALMKGTEPPVNDTETYDNGTGVIPSYLCEPKACTIDNYQELLIDSGYYTEADLNG